VALEAAAMALPLVATAVPGCIDAVKDGETGVLVPARDVDALVTALERYLADSSLRARHGEAGRRRASSEFQQDHVWAALAREYATLLEARCSSNPELRPITDHGAAERVVR
jgi:glycosyltransferase involved in cell wall biosynthesis